MFLFLQKIRRIVFIKIDNTEDIIPLETKAMGEYTICCIRLTLHYFTEGIQLTDSSLHFSLHELLDEYRGPESTPKVDFSFC